MKPNSDRLNDRKNCINDTDKLLFDIKEILVNISENIEKILKKKRL